MNDLVKSGHWADFQGYNFARIVAVAASKDPEKRNEYAKRAVELLDKAFQMGYMDVESVRKEPDFGQLRDRPDFQKLLERVGKSR